MKAMTARTAVHYRASDSHTSMLSQWIESYMKAYKEAFRENKTSILCGIAAAGGNRHMYPIYSVLKENENTDK